MIKEIATSSSTRTSTRLQVWPLESNMLIENLMYFSENLQLVHTVPDKLVHFHSEDVDMAT